MPAIRQLERPFQALAFFASPSSPCRCGPQTGGSRSSGKPPARASAVFDAGETVPIADVVMAETVWTLSGRRYRLARAEPVAVLERLFSEPNIRFEDDRAVWRAVQAYKNTAPAGRYIPLPSTASVRNFGNPSDEPHGTIEFARKSTAASGNPAGRSGEGIDIRDVGGDRRLRQAHLGRWQVLHREPVGICQEQKENFSVVARCFPHGFKGLGRPRGEPAVRTPPFSSLRACPELAEEGLIPSSPGSTAGAPGAGTGLNAGWCRRRS